ncbi:hypothetical protein EVA_08006 [gut metagenome]|uniref:Uncharacterized protein n=1 Tax=gut metagenome TaxID=749906 RepID=J9GAM1_9ZZZZ
MIRIMAGGNHHASIRTLGTGQIRDRGRRNRSAKHHVDTGGGKTGLQGRFKHIAGHTRVFADQHRSMTVTAVAAQYATGSLT